MESLKDLAKAEETKKIGAVYNLLSRVFMGEVDAQFLRQLRTGCFYESLKDAGIDFGHGFLNQPEEGLLEDLGVEYCRLFITGQPPYESVYLEGRYCGESMVEIKNFYQRCGMSVKDEKIMPDHIGLELELMSYLKQRQSEAQEQNNHEGVLKWMGLSREFMSAHPCKWANEFFILVEQEAQHPFYKQMAKLGKRLMEIEMNEVM